MENIEEICKEILEDYPDKANNYRLGLKSVMGLFIGELMKRTKNEADPKEGTKVFKKLLNQTL